MNEPFFAMVLPVGQPPGADNSLPGGQGGRPSNTLPNAPVRPGQGLPGGQGGQAGQDIPHDEAWVLVFSPASGYHWTTVRDLVSTRPDAGLPQPPNVAGQPLPGQPNVPGGGPVPPQGGTKPVPTPPPTAGTPLPGGPPAHGSGQPVPPGSQPPPAGTKPVEPPPAHASGQPVAPTATPQAAKPAQPQPPRPGQPRR